MSNEKCYLTIFLPKKSSLLVFVVPAGLAMNACTYSAVGKLSHSSQPLMSGSLISSRILWIQGRLSGDQVGQVKIAIVCSDHAAPNPALVYWYFKKAQRAEAPGCLSSHCLLNHWRDVGLSMHEKVLSTSTLKKASKMKKRSTSKQLHWMCPHEPECTLRLLLCHSDLTAPVTARLTSHRYYSIVIYPGCLRIVFVLL